MVVFLEARELARLERGAAGLAEGAGKCGRRIALAAQRPGVQTIDAPSDCAPMARKLFALGNAGRGQPVIVVRTEWRLTVVNQVDAAQWEP